MADQLDFNRLWALDANADGAGGAKARFYETGTANLVTVYADEGLTTAHPSPLVADAAGVFAPVYYGGATAVKVVVTAADDSALFTADPVRRTSSGGTSAATVSFAPSSGLTSETVQAAIEEVKAEIDDSGLVVVKSGGYTVAPSDASYLIRCTSTLTLALTAAASLGDGFSVWVEAAGGTVTIDPNGSETVDGAATLALYDGDRARVVCDGFNFFAQVIRAVLDEDDMAADSATRPPSQQSTKAYVDDEITSAIAAIPPSKVLLASGAIPSAGQDITAFNNTLYHAYELMLTNVDLGTSGRIRLRTSSDGGTSFDSGSNYTTPAGGGQSSISLYLEEDALQHSIVAFMSGAATGDRFMVMSQYVGHYIGTVTKAGVVGGSREDTTLVDALRLFTPSDQFISGDWYFYGYKRSS